MYLREKSIQGMILLIHILKYGTGFLIEAKYVAKTSSNFIIEIL